MEFWQKIIFFHWKSPNYLEKLNNEYLGIFRLDQFFLRKMSFSNLPTPLKYEKFHTFFWRLPLVTTKDVYNLCHIWRLFVLLCLSLPSFNYPLSTFHASYFKSNVPPGRNKICNKVSIKLLKFNHYQQFKAARLNTTLIWR